MSRSAKVLSVSLTVIAVVILLLLQVEKMHHKKSKLEEDSKMPQTVLIYVKATCPYCIRALALLDSKGISYTKVDILAEPHRREEMIAKADGRTTVPQIFIGEEGIGGYDDLNELDQTGQLNEMLGLVD